MITQIENLSWSFEDDDGDPISQTLKSGKTWSSDVMGVVNHMIANHKSNATVVDVGAHIGSFAVQCASKYPRWEVVGVEGSKTNFGHLLTNKKQNDLSNLSVFNHCVGNGTSIQFDYGNSGSHVATQEKKGVDVETAKRFDEEFSFLTSLDFLKVDIEGFEIEFFKGATKLIKKFEPIIFFEVNGHTLKFFDKMPNHLLAYVEEVLGYRLFLFGQNLIPLNNYQPFPFGVCDVIAVRDKDLSKLWNLGLPMCSSDIVPAFTSTFERGNDDIKNYCKWYGDKFQLLHKIVE